MAEYIDDIDRSNEYIDKAKERLTNNQAKYYSLEDESRKALRRYLDVEKGTGKVKITKIDLSPSYDEVTPDSLIEWIVWTGYVDAYIRQKMKRGLDPDYEDYRQEIWIQIISIKEKLCRIYKEDGKPSFLNYIKMICNQQIISNSSICYKKIRYTRREKENYFNDDGWDIIDQTYDPDEQPIYNRIEYSAENPFDDYYDYTNDDEKLLELSYDKKFRRGW